MTCRINTTSLPEKRSYLVFCNTSFFTKSMGIVKGAEGSPKAPHIKSFRIRFAPPIPNHRALNRHERDERHENIILMGRIL